MTSEKHPLGQHITKIAKGAGVLFVGSLLARASGYPTRLIIARGLGASQYGLLSLASTVLTFATTFSTLGLGKGVGRFVALFRGKEEYRKVRGVLVTGYAVVIPLSIGVGAILFVCSGWIAAAVFHSPPLAPIIRIFSLGVPILSTLSLTLSGFGGFKRMSYKVYSRDLLRYFARFVLVAAAVLLGLGLIGVSWMYVVSLGLASGVGIFLLKRLVPELKPDSDPPFLGKKVLSYSLPLFISGVIGIIMSRIDVLMLGSFMSPKEVGLYNAARPTATLLGEIPPFFAGIFGPVITELFGKGQKDEMEELFYIVKKWLLFVLVPCTLVLLLFPRAILTFLFGTKYRAGSMALRILALGFFFSYSFTTSKSLLKSIGKTRLMLYVTSFVATVNVILNFFLIPVLGMKGAALSTALSIGGGGGGMWALLARREAWVTPFKRRHLLILLSGAISALGGFLVFKAVPLHGFLTLAASTALLFCIYVVLLAGFGLVESPDLLVIEALERKTGVGLGWVKKLIRGLAHG